MARVGRPRASARKPTPAVLLMALCDLSVRRASPAAVTPVSRTRTLVRDHPRSPTDPPSLFSTLFPPHRNSPVRPLPPAPWFPWTIWALWPCPWSWGLTAGSRTWAAWKVSSSAPSAWSSSPSPSSFYPASITSAENVPTNSIRLDTPCLICIECHLLCSVGLACFPLAVLLAQHDSRHLPVMTIRCFPNKH